MADESTTRARGAGGRGRQVPREFKFHWGGGQIVEEASYVGKHTEPAIQLLEYEGHRGSYGIRFCYYNLDGRFQRSPIDDRRRGLFRGAARSAQADAEAAGDAAQARDLGHGRDHHLDRIAPA